jgi:hypothetical protein
VESELSNSLIQGLRGSLRQRVRRDIKAHLRDTVRYNARAIPFFNTLRAS